MKTTAAMTEMMTKPSAMRSRAAIAALVLSLVVSVSPSEARVLKSIGKSLQSSEQTFTIGGGLDFQSDEGEDEYDLSLLAEYGFTEDLKAAFEPNFIYIRGSAGSINGLGEFEASLNYDFYEIEEPELGLSALALIKLPTASQSELGTGETDFTPRHQRKS
ncbi:MAG: hypothetical protein IPH10_08840 [bacterium]|nr:hypothetical protein [bacterium]